MKEVSETHFSTILWGMKAVFILYCYIFIFQIPGQILTIGNTLYEVSHLRLISIRGINLVRQNTINMIIVNLLNNFKFNSLICLFNYYCRNINVNRQRLLQVSNIILLFQMMLFKSARHAF